MDIENKPEHTLKYKKIILFVSIIVALAVLVFYFVEQKALQQRLDDTLYSAKNNSAQLGSLLEGNPKPLQDSLSYDLKNNINDKYTKSDAYFLTHRYFDNGGDIYEIYDYVNSHAELAFLKEAESIFPMAFDSLKNKSLPPVYTDAGMYILLAYLETVDKQGYADIAAQATLTNQYTKLALFGKEKAKSFPTGYPTWLIEENIKKSILFAKKTQSSIMKLLQDNGLTLEDVKNPTKFFATDQITLKDITARDFLVGLNQYGASLRYLKAYGVTFPSSLSSNEIFALTMSFSNHVVPELEIFTSLLNASTLALSNTSSSRAIQTALSPILKLGVLKTEETGIVKKILDARLEKDYFFPRTNIKYVSLDVYGKKNMVTLATKVPKFKTWLISNGWQESDFK